MPNSKKVKTEAQNRQQFIRTVKRTGKWRGKKKTINDVK